MISLVVVVVVVAFWVSCFVVLRVVRVLICC